MGSVQDLQQSCPGEEGSHTDSALRLLDPTPASDRIATRELGLGVGLFPACEGDRTEARSQTRVPWEESVEGKTGTLT